MPIPLVLASQSPARLATLRSAGVKPHVIVSHLHEDAVLAALPADTPPADAVLALARAKAQEVAGNHAPHALVLGCDSMLEFGGQILGKPGDAATATARWRQMRGETGVLHTGHWVIDARTGSPAQELGATSSTAVHFADLTDAEIDAYVATGEPLSVAGGFTVDGLGGPYVEAIEGDYHGVVGVSLPLLRRLLAELGVAFHDLRDPAAL